MSAEYGSVCVFSVSLAVPPAAVSPYMMWFTLKRLFSHSSVTKALKAVTPAHVGEDSCLLHNVRGTEQSLKNSLANGNAPLKKTCQRKRFVSELHWQRNRKANSGGKSLISEIEAEETVNKRA